MGLEENGEAPLLCFLPEGGALPPGPPGLRRSHGPAGAPHSQFPKQPRTSYPETWFLRCGARAGRAPWLTGPRASVPYSLGLTFPRLQNGPMQCAEAP